ncbi:MAG: hypothetical protein CBD58_04485 [bacterium TMED198]|nr:MAG: hypothetical protein CBD58_04485 [bacterium TMED198]|tara:strand:+ start:210 stop:1382 length:1173 start_codon:yes stop_codon:yes gene_type:complete
MKKVLVIGAGLSGLSCAHHLKKNNVEVEVYEKNDSCGGRASSDKVNGFILDKGFQVLLNNYSELKNLDIYKDLDLQYFDSGAKVFLHNKNYSLFNPIYHPLKFLRSNVVQIFSGVDLFKIVSFLLFSDKGFIKQSTSSFLKNTLSKKSLKLFFFPFFGGVFLSEDLENDASFFLKVFKKFALGRAGLPSGGMSMLSKKIIEKSNIDVSYNYELSKISGHRAHFKNGRSARFDKVVLAMPLHETNRFMKLNLDLDYNSTSTFYISSKENRLGKSILLVPDESFETNSVQCLTNISKSYSDTDKSLYSVSSLNLNSSEEKILNEFTLITGIDRNNISLEKTYRIKRALHKFREEIKSKNNILFCGDWSTEPSIDGAIKSGRLTAKKILNSFK